MRVVPAKREWYELADGSDPQERAKRGEICGRMGACVSVWSVQFCVEVRHDEGVPHRFEWARFREEPV